MKKLLTLAALSAAAMATPAMAQDSAPAADFYIGAQGGYHDLDTGVARDDGAIYGVYSGVDFPLGETLIGGVEGNYTLGSGAIDNEYGIAAKLGVRVGETGQVFVRGGYQEVNFDLSHIAGGPVPAGLDDTDGDYLVGVGGQFKLNDTMSLRATVDTIAFDTTRAMAGIAFHF